MYLHAHFQKHIFDPDFNCVKVGFLHQRYKDISRYMHFTVGVIII